MGHSELSIDNLIKCFIRNAIDTLEAHKSNEYFRTCKSINESLLFAESYAMKYQLHPVNHSFTCFKYGDKLTCRFDFPKPLVQESFYDEETGTVTQK
jgi:hypothetical protein